MTLFDRMKEAVKAIINYADMKTTSKDKLVKTISSAIEELNIVDEILTSLTSLEKKKLKNDFMNNAGMYSDEFLKTFFKNYHHDLINKAEAIEVRQPFESIHLSVKNLKRMLEESLKGNNLDQLFEEDVIVIKDCRISQAMFFLTVSLSRMIAKYSTYLLGIAMSLSYLKESSKESVPLYKLKFLKENYKAFVQAVGATSLQTGNFSYMNDIKAIRRNAAIDLSLGVFDSVDASVVSSSFQKVQGFNVITLIGQGLLIAINPIVLIGESWSQYKHAVNQRNQYLLEWMQNRMALLRLEQSTSVDEAKRVKIQASIDKYEELIALYEQKIADYERG